MRIKNLHIENFRSIESLEIQLDDTTVFIGPNNAGKTGIVEAVRIALSRRWGQRGTGFTEDDVHLSEEKTDPRTAPPVKVSFNFEEPSAGAWPEDMIADLEHIMILTPTGLNKVSFSITYTWNVDKEIFEPAWEFLNSSGAPLPSRSRSINLSGFYEYVLFLWLGALRDIDDEFASRSRNWGGLLRSVRIPPALEKTIKETLDNLDSELLKADPKLSQIADTIGHATEIAMENTAGSAKLRMLPMNVWDLLARAGVVLRNEDLRPWLPLGHHGQGLQSLSIIFLFQAAAAQQISDDLHEGTEPIFAIEEPEAHLHPQAARTLWSRISEIPGQKLVTTHSPYFVQNVPLHNLRIVRLRNGSTQVAFLPRKIESSIPWTTNVENLVNVRGINYLTKNNTTGNIDSICSFDESMANDLVDCWKNDLNVNDMKTKINQLRHESRILISAEEERELSFLGRRIRGEIFFARRWILVEGVCEYLLLKALGEILDYDLDQHGVSVIDFQNNGNATIYAALADGFEIPWRMVSDGDGESEKFKRQLVKKGFNDSDLVTHLSTLPVPNSLEDQLLADGHENLLREILRDTGIANAMTCSIDDFKRMLKNKKTVYMSHLATMVAQDAVLAAKMPSPFITLIEDLKSGQYS